VFLFRPGYAATAIFSNPFFHFDSGRSATSFESNFDPDLQSTTFVRFKQLMGFPDLR